MSVRNRAGASEVFVAWKAAWHSAALRVQMLVTIPLLVVVLMLFSQFLEWVELRPGVILRDPVVASFEARDFTWPIFTLVYVGLVVGLGTLIPHPERLIIALQSYILMVCIRFAAMYVTPLDPPSGIIPLTDPFVQFFGSGTAPTKDLFFSGHTSTLILLALTVTKRWLTWWFAFSAAAVGILIVWQHVHYTIDVLVAPLVAYASYRFVSFLQQKSESRKG